MRQVPAAALHAGVLAGQLKKWQQQPALVITRAPDTAGNIALPSGYIYISQGDLQEPTCPCEEVHQGSRECMSLGAKSALIGLQKWPQHPVYTLKRAPGTAANIALPSGYIYISQDDLQEPQCPCEEVNKGSREATPEDWARIC